MDSATRVTRARTPLSRSGVPTRPWRYLLATMLVAVMDQELGTSTSFCSKMSLPFQSWMTASRFSQVSSSKGETPGLVKWRVKRKPGVLLGGGGGGGGGSRSGLGERFGHGGETFRGSCEVPGSGAGGCCGILDRRRRLLGRGGRRVSLEEPRDRGMRLARPAPL